PPSKVASVFLSIDGQGDGIAVRQERQDGGAGDGHSAGDAVVPGPGTILVLEFEHLGFYIAIPRLPFGPSTSMETVTDVQVREELFASERSEPVDELRIGELARDGFDFGAVLGAILSGAGKLLEFLRALIQRNARRRRHHGDCFRCGSSCDSGSNASTHDTGTHGSRRTNRCSGSLRICFYLVHSSGRHLHSLLLRHIQAARG